jgi:hypothetical protein
VPAIDAQITYEDLLQSEQILVKSKSLTDEQLHCLSGLEGSSPYPIVILENAELTRRSYHLQHQQERVDAKEWLRARNLLASLPSYNPAAETVSQFARRLEAFCGIEPGSMLTTHELGMLTIKPEWTEQSLMSPSKGDQDKFWCLMNAMSASNLEEQGVRFGFIGNEAYSPDEPQK